MARTPSSSNGHFEAATSSSVDALLLAALERGDDSLETGRYLVTYKEGARAEGGDALVGMGLRVAHAADFDDQAFSIEDVGDADVVTFSELGVALMSGAAFQERGMGVAALSADSPIEAIEPEHFVFADNLTSEYLRGFARAASLLENLDRENGEGWGELNEALREPPTFEGQVLGVTWGLKACRVPTSAKTAAGIKIAVLDTGMDLGHPDFAGRAFTTATFVGQPVQDLNSHGTHCIGTAAGPKTPPGAIQRYGIGHKAPIFVGKVLTNSGSGTTATVLAGMNWAIANKCPVISMSLGAQIPVQAAYTAAGQAALNNGCLIIAAAGNAGGATGAPANSPTIVSVASLDQNLAPSSFSNFGKVDIAGPGRDVFSSVPRPTRYGIKSGTSMATPHVAGCAALLAQTSPAIRGLVLRNRLLALARALPHPANRVGRGLVQAIQ